MHGAGLTAVGLAAWPLMVLGLPVLPVVGVGVVLCLRGAERRRLQRVRKQRQGQ